MQWLLEAVRTGLEHELRREVERHITALGLDMNGNNGGRSVTKDDIRRLHLQQRYANLRTEYQALQPQIPRLTGYFAEGHEVDPRKIYPQLIPVSAADSEEGRLFRLATTLWSVPVSKGYGRRMRFLVIDRQTGKLIGIFALGDPVFNLRVRDDWIGWSVKQRERRLVNVMDAYVVGAVPPYNQLLGGKLIASLIGSAEVADSFERRYAGSKSIIRKRIRRPKLALVTVTSALGRSSIYNRLRLGAMGELIRIGTTVGYGHFHVSHDLFRRMRDLLRLHGHKYADGYDYGRGPNWRMRVIREALQKVGLDGELLHHGVEREVFAMPIAKNWRDYLIGKTTRLKVERPPADHIS
ncbi:MAG: Druantia anti-phage system protein DruA, partial [Acidobacteriota bacterium]